MRIGPLQSIARDYLLALSLSRVGCKTAFCASGTRGARALSSLAIDCKGKNALARGDVLCPAIAKRAFDGEADFRPVERKVVVCLWWPGKNVLDVLVAIFGFCSVPFSSEKTLDRYIWCRVSRSMLGAEILGNDVSVCVQRSTTPQRRMHA